MIGVTGPADGRAPLHLYLDKHGDIKEVPGTESSKAQEARDKLEEKRAQREKQDDEKRKADLVHNTTEYDKILSTWHGLHAKAEKNVDDQIEEERKPLTKAEKEAKQETNGEGNKIRAESTQPRWKRIAEKLRELGQPGSFEEFVAKHGERPSARLNQGKPPVQNQPEVPGAPNQPAAPPVVEAAVRGIRAQSIKARSEQKWDKVSAFDTMAQMIEEHGGVDKIPAGPEYEKFKQALAQSEK
jgi:hypothetical protein